MRVRHKQESWLVLVSTRWSSCWEHLNQSLHADQPPSIGAFKTGHSLTDWIQKRFNGSPSGAGVHFSCKSFQPQYGSIAFRQFAFVVCRLQCCAGMRNNEFSIPMYSDSVCFRNCNVKIRDCKVNSGCQISTTHVSIVRGKIEIFFTKFSSVATYITFTRWWCFVAMASSAMNVNRSDLDISNGCAVIGWIASSINW